LKNSETDNISNKELKRITVRMINKIKEEMYMQMNAFIEDTNKHVNELKQNSNKQLDEIRKTMQDTKGKFNKNKLKS
jgi:DNA anti-recombination protein RmuC